MKYLLILLLAVIVGCQGNQKEIKYYSVATTLQLLESPNESSKKVVDIKASDITKTEEYCIIDNTNKLLLLDDTEGFVKVKVVEPEWQSKSHIGWVKKNMLVDFGSSGSIVHAIPQSPKASYEIVQEKVFESNVKAQLIEYVVYNDTLYTESALKNVLEEVYTLTKDKQLFKNYSSATVVAVYLFTSRSTFTDKSNWIARLTKSRNESVPDIQFNEFKLRSLQGLEDKVQSKDEIALNELNKYLQERGLDLCKLAEEFKVAELANIHKADAIYPDYGDRHMAMIERLDEEYYAKLKKRYRLDDDMLSKVSIFAMSYCK